MGTPPAVALWLLVGAAPVCGWVAWSDMARLRIPNLAVAALAGVYAALGLMLMPLDGWTLGDWAWRWSHLVVILLAGMALNAAGAVGAGDAKFAAAAAPFFAAADWRQAIAIYAAMVLLAFVAHRAAKHSVGPALAPEWRSWASGKRFPMGLALGGTLVAYLALAASSGAA